MDKLIRSDQSLTEQPTGSMLRLKKGEKLPSGARMMTDDEVLEMQRKTVMNWQPRHQM